jgi:hypothetical protein
MKLPIFFALLTVPAILSAAPAQPVTLTAVKAQLYYEGTGRLSPDIISMPDFVTRNIPIGEGSAEENANDMLVTVQLRAKSQENISQLLRITIRGNGNRILSDRSFRAGLTSKAGVIWKAVWVRDIGCEGPVRIDVSFGQQKMSHKLNFKCGE